MGRAFQSAEEGRGNFSQLDDEPDKFWDRLVFASIVLVYPPAYFNIDNHLYGQFVHFHSATYYNLG